MAKVKFNYYSSIQNFTKANPKPDKGTISFVKDTESGKNTIYLGENEFSCNESAVKAIIKAFLKTGEADLNLKDLAAQVGTNKKAIETNTGNITTLTGKVNELDQKALMSIVEVVTQLPEVDKAKTNTIYLVRNAEGDGDNTYIEYLLIEVESGGNKEKKFEMLGKHQMTVDLTPYAKTSQLSEYAKKTELGSVKATAEGASATANEAKTTANKAKTTAEGASATANEAKTTANKAKTTAEGASTTANEAKTTAEGASATANKAKTTAEGASTTANEAKTTANEAKTTTDALSNKIDQEIKDRKAADTAIDEKIQASVAGAMTWGGDGITE